MRDDKGVGRLTLTAENEDDREFITGIYRIIGDPSIERQEQGVETIRYYLRGFPAKTANHGKQRGGK